MSFCFFTGTKVNFTHIFAVVTRETLFTVRPEIDIVIAKLSYYRI